MDNLLCNHNIVWSRPSRNKAGLELPRQLSHQGSQVVHQNFLEIPLVRTLHNDMGWNYAKVSTPDYFRIRQRIGVFQPGGIILVLKTLSTSSVTGSSSTDQNFWKKSRRSLPKPGAFSAPIWNTSTLISNEATAWLSQERSVWGSVGNIQLDKEHGVHYSRVYSVT